MDPITQGAVGATASLLISPRQQKLGAAALGAASGMAADLDVLITSPVDPLLFLEYHRHFTHSLLFIPIGALLCAFIYCLVFHRIRLSKGAPKHTSLSFRVVYFYCLAGYATHAALDACTSYGTQLFWPISDARVAWDVVSVIDPLFSLPILMLIAFSIVKRKHSFGVLAAVYALAYLGAGAAQNERASGVAQKLASSRGHTPINLSVKPSFANIIVWKSVYEYQGDYYVDAVRVGLQSRVYDGTVARKMALAEHFPWLQKGSQQTVDIERFRWFSNDHLGLDPNNPNRIIDIRYSVIPNQVTGMWGIVVDPNARFEEHVKWTSNRPKGDEAKIHFKQLWQLIIGGDLSKTDT